MIAQPTPPEHPGGRARAAGGRRKAFRRAALLLLVLGVPPLLFSCFPGPVRDLWPPRGGEAGRRIEVVLWDWHSRVVEELPAGSNGSHREWEYCEKAWYLEGRQGSSGAMRALLWPSVSGVGKLDVSAPAWERLPAGEYRRFRFVLSEAGAKGMQAHLDGQLGRPIPGHPGWHEGARSYHLFHSCHHFTAAALRAAGLPIRPWWAFSESLFVIQLERIARFHREAGR